MEVLRKDMEHTLGARRIYPPGSAEQNKYRDWRAVGIEKLEERVYGLGLHEYAVGVRSALSTALPSCSSPVVCMQNTRINFPPLGVGVGAIRIIHQR
jgi:hypothetical protein